MSDRFMSDHYTPSLNVTFYVDGVPASQGSKRYLGTDRGGRAAGRMVAAVALSLGTEVEAA